MCNNELNYKTKVKTVKITQNSTGYLNFYIACIADIMGIDILPQKTFP